MRNWIRLFSRRAYIAMIKHKINLHKLHVYSWLTWSTCGFLNTISSGCKVWVAWLKVNQDWEADWKPKCICFMSICLFFQVTILLCVLLFVFASYGVQCYSGRLYRCNDVTKQTKAECTGAFMRSIKVTDMDIPDGKGVKILVPRVWWVYTL